MKGLNDAVSDSSRDSIVLACCLSDSASCDVMDVASIFNRKSIKIEILIIWQVQDYLKSYLQLPNGCIEIDRIFCDLHWKPYFINWSNYNDALLSFFKPDHSETTHTIFTICTHREKTVIFLITWRLSSVVRLSLSSTLYLT